MPLNLNDLLCPGDVCNAAIGNVVTYRDDSHLTDPFARSLTWAFDERLRPGLPSLFPPQ
ncbi:SGNH hydrolase domain-containing protein [Subtercola boreus]|uniref:SGNH hydrolase domain-containing protein n=1 Tax=Subtercola boreus TaxID=120213 RepID=UPI00345F564B